MTSKEILDALAIPEGLPRAAMIAAGEQREEMIPFFVSHIKRLTKASIDTLDETDFSSFLCIYFLLGEWRDARAYRPLAAFLRQDPELVERLLGDAITEATAHVMAGVYDGDLRPIIDLVEDPAADVFVRSQMIDALAIIARVYPEARGSVETYLEQFFESEFAKPELLWGAWAFVIADLGLTSMVPKVKQAFDLEWISPDEADFKFFEEQLNKAVEAGESPWFHDSRNTLLIENAVEELSGWYCFSDEFIQQKNQIDTSGNMFADFFGDTFERDAPKVGRNDPCPCGSGKKFKKCCLQ